MKTVFEILLLVWLAVVTIALIDRPTNYEVDLLWQAMDQQAQQIERARMLSSAAFLAAEKLRREMKEKKMIVEQDGEYPWLQEWFAQRSGRDPFQRMQ